jgi:hypothetical protein
MAKTHLVVAKFTKNEESPRRVKVYTAWRLVDLKLVSKSITYPQDTNEVSVNFFLDTDTDVDDLGYLDLIYLDFNVFDESKIPSEPDHKIYIRSFQKDPDTDEWTSNDEASILTKEIPE